MEIIYLLTPLSCLIGAIIAGFFGKRIGRVGARRVTIGGVAIAFVLSVIIFVDVMNGNLFNGPVYTWAVSEGTVYQIGFLIDELTAMMMVVVTFVSFMVHIYTIGYMEDDPGYQRFFSYIALFTFSMLMLVMSNNFLQLFFGWEAVGLVSYLLIGFWFKKDTAVAANLKAFLVNRVGDFGFLLGIGGVLYLFGTLDYAEVFAAAPDFAKQTVPGTDMLWMTLICLLLFVGAMGKSAQVPLHVWLPDSMEGPTPISALIHAATMVTAGIFMVARMSPMFELSDTALNFVLIIGSITAFSMALVGLVQNDIKRVIAYSTLSQLGYMTVALGASAYAAGIFHLGTHAFFKALLFLAAGSVIIALHHEQDMRNMGGLRRVMPITWMTMIIGTLALIGTPGFSGFFSKDAIIEAAHYSQQPAAGFAYYALTAGTFVTAFYSWRLIFLTFYGQPRDREKYDHAKESPWVVTLPLILLAIPSVIIGWIFVEPMLFGDFFGNSIVVRPEHDTLARLAEHNDPDRSAAWQMVTHGILALPVVLTLLGSVLAWIMYIVKPDLPAKVAGTFSHVYRMLLNKYGFDEFNQVVFAGGAKSIGSFFWRIGDVKLIDGLMVNGTARLVGWISSVVRRIQTGYVYHYAFAMIIGLFVLMTWFLSS